MVEFMGVSCVKIAVIADTHGRVPAGLREAVRGFDEVWHLGDVCDAATLEAVCKIGPPALVIAGNNDYGLDLPLTLDLERNGRCFHLIHILPRTPSCPDLLLHGHTHVPRDETVNGVRCLNPGSIGKANKGAPASWAVLTIEPDGSIQWDVRPASVL